MTQVPDLTFVSADARECAGFRRQADTDAALYQFRDRGDQGLRHFLVNERLRFQDTHQALLRKGAGKTGFASRHVAGKKDGGSFEEQQQVLQRIDLPSRPEWLGMVVGQIGSARSCSMSVV